MHAHLRSHEPYGYLKELLDVYEQPFECGLVQVGSILRQENYLLKLKSAFLKHFLDGRRAVNANVV